MELEPNPEATNFDIITERCPCPRWDWFVDDTREELERKARRRGMRITRLESYLNDDDQRRYAGILVNNSSPSATRVGDLLRAGSTLDVGVWAEEFGVEPLSHMAAAAMGEDGTRAHHARDALAALATGAPP